MTIDELMLNNYSIRNDFDFHLESCMTDDKNIIVSNLHQIKLRTGYIPSFSLFKISRKLLQGYNLSDFITSFGICFALEEFEIEKYLVDYCESEKDLPLMYLYNANGLSYMCPYTEGVMNMVRTLENVEVIKIAYSLDSVEIFKKIRVDAFNSVMWKKIK